MSYHAGGKRKCTSSNGQPPCVCENKESHNCDGECKKRVKIILRVSKRRKISIEKAPDVKNIKDLITIAQKEDVLYDNINSHMLKSITPQLIELDKLIGMTELKESMFDQILYYLQDMHKVGKNDFLHTCIMGDPGCGKTTVAKIIAEIYKNAGILSSQGVFKIAGRADLVGKYLGQTAPKTKALLESCIGGVLFIDEVYSLGSGDTKSTTDSYSEECINTINQFLSEHKDDFCLIVAGYRDKIINQFFAVNEGLVRRFPWMHTIKPYEPSELSEIAMKMLNDIQWKTKATNEELSKIIKEEKDMFEHSGGSVENWIAKVKLAHSRRVFSLDYKDKYILSLEDFKNGLKIMKKQRVKNKEDEPPIGMYM